MPITAPDLTQRPPRSPRVRLGGYVILPRCLDKGRAMINGKNGDYHYNCPLDQRFLGFAGIDADKLKEQLAQGKSDSEILTWIQANATAKPTEGQIIAWSTIAENRAPADIESRDYFSVIQKSCAPAREDISTWFELLDADDHVTFGGKA